MPRTLATLHTNVRYAPDTPLAIGCVLVAQLLGDYVRSAAELATIFNRPRRLFLFLVYLSRLCGFFLMGFSPGFRVGVDTLICTHAFWPTL